LLDIYSIVLKPAAVKGFLHGRKKSCLFPKPSKTREAGHSGAIMPRTEKNTYSGKRGAYLALPGDFFTLAGFASGH
jgi:hypothetical protein